MCAFSAYVDPGKRRTLVFACAGKCLIATSTPPILSLTSRTSCTYREFEASVVILHHSTTIGCGYQPVIHCGVLRQAAEIVGIKGRETLKTGERAIVKFRFMYFADYLLPGSTFIFREGRAKGIGKVVQVFPLNVANPG
jgi:GTPase